MWDSFYEFLFNPNHEMPIAAFIVIGIMSICLNTWVQKEGERRRNNNQNSQNRSSYNYSETNPAWHAPKKKKRSKKK